MTNQTQMPKIELSTLSFLGERFERPEWQVEDPEGRIGRLTIEKELIHRLGTINQESVLLVTISPITANGDDNDVARIAKLKKEGKIVRFAQLRDFRSMGGQAEFYVISILGASPSGWIQISPDLVLDLLKIRQDYDFEIVIEKITVTEEEIEQEAQRLKKIFE